jgi:hypothetical protein
VKVSPALASASIARPRRTSSRSLSYLARPSLGRFRMRGFVRDVGRQSKLASDGLLIGADLNCQLVRLEPLHPRMKQRSLRPCQALKPPHTVNHTIHEEFLDRSHRRADCPNPVPEVLECVRVFSWEDDVLGKEAVPERVETDDGFALRRLWSRGVRALTRLAAFCRSPVTVPVFR